ncbi:MAG: SURF1 family protein [Actinobacteria bacterium]|nr:SURF1 family protein [Actinomycetota bacterium]MBU1494777.1 SURF1 family protein [Actinomycetota bacterium]MBU1866439.1 SURF1 family protein [Actinomycetota bacterium]
MKRLLTARWIAGHLLALAGVVGFVFLGLWQLDRHEQKREIRDAVEAAADLPVVALSDAEGDPTYRVVWAVGEYDTAAEVLVLRSQAGTAGYAVVTPLRLPDGSAVLVNRGWVPLGDQDPPGPVAAPEGEVRVTGQMWPSVPGAIPAELPPVMKRIDPVTVAAFTTYPIREDSYLLAFDQIPPPESEGLVLPDRLEVSLGPHLGYAGQWFLFALVVLVGYPLLLRKTLRS